jgi:hypothetical protein
MIENFFQRVLAYWATAYYMQGLVIFVALISLRRVQMQKENLGLKRLFQLYLTSVLLLIPACNFVYAINLFNARTVYVTVEFINDLFNLVEAYVFLTLISSFAETRKRHKQLIRLFQFNVLISCVGVAVLFNSFTKNDTFRWAAISSLLHFYTIVIACIWYFLDIYQLNKPINTKQIYLVLPIASYSLISIPIFAITEYSYASNFNDELYLIHFMFLCIVCLAFGFSSRNRIMRQGVFQSTTKVTLERLSELESKGTSTKNRTTMIKSIYWSQLTKRNNYYLKKCW